MKFKAVKIDGIIHGSIAEEAGICTGDRIVSVNGEKLQDIFDYRLLTDTENLTMTIEKENGELLELTVEKGEGEDIGILFADPLFNGTRRCRNKCIFCFVDQLPKGMRKSLYFKDDDSRLSFLSGNYVTLTNIDREEIKRIIRYRMSPVNISVHTTDLELRRFMLGNSSAGDVLENIKLFYEGGIDVNCQIVLCRGINDGDALVKTFDDLTRINSAQAGGQALVKSISVVPAGITRYRQRLYHIEPFDKDASSDVLKIVHDWQKRLLEMYGTRIIYAADEFYLKACAAIPEYETYEDFPQLENGVGMISLFRQEFRDALSALPAFNLKGKTRRVSIATGSAAYDLISASAAELVKLVNGSRDDQNGPEQLDVNVYQIQNEFFGAGVTISGLITGADIAGQLKGRELGDELLIPENMLKYGENVFLDGYTIDMLREILGIDVTPVNNCGTNFINSILGNKKAGIQKCPSL